MTDEGGLFDTLNPTLLENGMYRIRLEAVDINGQARIVERVYRVDGQAKVGNLIISFIDLDVPVAGIPITVTRTYDSRNKARQQDFGFGRDLSVNSGTYENNRTPGEGFRYFRAVSSA